MTTSKMKSVADKTMIAGFVNEMQGAKSDAELMEVGAKMAKAAGWRIPNAAEIIKGYVVAMEVLGATENDIKVVTTMAAQATRVIMRKNDGEDANEIVADEMGEDLMSADLG